jgi:hypothetical protein
MVEEHLDVMWNTAPQKPHHFRWDLIAEVKAVSFGQRLNAADSRFR